jgi:hypothetical protein
LKNVDFDVEKGGFTVIRGARTTLLVLIPEPLVTDFTVMEIAGWLLVVYASIFVISLFPVLRLAGKPILEMMRKP